MQQVVLLLDCVNRADNKVALIERMPCMVLYEIPKANNVDQGPLEAIHTSPDWDTARFSPLLGAGETYLRSYIGIPKETVQLTQLGYQAC